MVARIGSLTGRLPIASTGIARWSMGSAGVRKSMFNPTIRKRTPSYISGSGTLLVSFSGGQTSAYMAKMLKKHSKNSLIFVFANTGQEKEKTLKFVDRVDKAFGLGVVWVEADVKPKGVGTKHRIVSFETASRNGEPFEAVVAKYGISNKAYPHCTRELKLAPIHDYMRTVAGRDYQTAIGIRADEYRRVRNKAGIVYPLADYWITSKEDVNEFWNRQPFALGLEEHQGNCIWCWKKSLKKHFMLIEETPEIFDFPRKMEMLYGKVRCPEGRRVFFRENRSTEDLFELHQNMGDIPPLFDTDSGCSESCEMYEAI